MLMRCSAAHLRHLGSSISDFIPRGIFLAGRRLTESDGISEDAIKALGELQAKFEDPSDVWASMGYDIKNDHDLMKLLPREASAADMSAVLQEVETSSSGARVCKN